MYKEVLDFGNEYRATYLEGLRKVVADRNEKLAIKRRDFLEDMEHKREFYRKQYLNMLGWPLNEEPQPIKNVTEKVFYETEDVIYTRMQFEVLDGLQFYGILFRHKTEEALPIVISQHGGFGTPELCSDFFGSGNYNDMTMRAFRKGVNVFAPQLALWGSPDFGPEPMRDEIDQKLKQLGGSITALEIYSILRCLDYFEEQSHCNKKFGMLGSSYGGFYTLHTAAADTRIKAALSCAHYNDRFQCGAVSTRFQNAAGTFMDAQVAALVCPRQLEIHVGDRDELFDVAGAKLEYEKTKEYFKSAPEQLKFHVFSGTHEFCPEDDEPIERLIEALGKNL